MNNLFDETIRTLHAAFPDIPIYDEDVPQNFQEPSFSVLQTRHEREQLLGEQWRDHAYLDVRYFPSDGTDQRAECREMGEKLQYVLAHLANYFARGKDMQYEIVDNVLHFTFRCSMAVGMRRDEENQMEGMIQNRAVK